MSHLLPDPGDFLDPVAAAGDEDVFYYEVPAAGLALVGIGVEESVEASGPERFETVQRAILARSGRDTQSPWVGGFGFADRTQDARFPAARWWRPRQLWMREGTAPGSCRGPSEVDPANTPCGPQAESEAHEVLDAHYRERVQRALGAIGRGELEKVVVARELKVSSRAPVDVPELLRALRQRHPACAVFAVKRDGAWFLGATPERLLRQSGEAFQVVALAGSARRGRSHREDSRLGRELIESKKEQSEHEVAVRGLREGLLSCGASLEIPESPELLRLSGVQHLYSRIEARWSGATPGLLEVAGRVHPTAAVCGAPRAAAQAWLAAHEELERGWYAGLLGWWRPGGEGELSAGLRCAQIEGRSARLFAGAGIVEGSDPDAEVRETRLKWNALLPALRAA